MEVIILKGLFYLKTLSEYCCTGYESMVKELSEGLDRMLDAKGEC